MIKNHELSVPRKEALSTGLLLDISHPARVYGGSLVPVALTRTLWRALAHNATFHDGDERIIGLCSQTALISSVPGPSGAIIIPGLQLGFMSFSWRGGRWPIRVMHHLTQEAEPVCTLCPSLARDLERCADVLCHYQGRELTLQMYRVLGLPAPEAGFDGTGKRGVQRLPVETAPEVSLRVR